jgi:hypothetical protein
VGRLERFVPALCWLAGLVAAFHPTFRSGFATVQGYPGNDPRLVAFILEHTTYRWLAGFPLHGDFWSPPIFFPQQGVGAYTEMLVGAAPPYWLARRGLGAADRLSAVDAGLLEPQLRRGLRAAAPGVRRRPGARRGRRAAVRVRQRARWRP